MRTPPGGQGVAGPRAADLLAEALEQCPLPPDDPRYARALGSLGTGAGSGRGHSQGAPGRDPRHRGGPGERRDQPRISHALVTSLWHGTTPEVADLQLERSREVFRIAQEGRDFETLGSAANFRAMVSYLLGHRRGAGGGDRRGRALRRDDRSALLPAGVRLPGPFRGLLAEATSPRPNAWANETPDSGQRLRRGRDRGSRAAFSSSWSIGNAATLARFTGPLRRARDVGRALGARPARPLHRAPDRARHAALFGPSVWTGTWPATPTNRYGPWSWSSWPRPPSPSATSTPSSGWPRSWREFEGLNLVAGTLIATFGSADRYLARIAALRGDEAAAEHHFTVALAMDRQMRSPSTPPKPSPTSPGSWPPEARPVGPAACATKPTRLRPRPGQARRCPVVEALGTSVRLTEGGPDAAHRNARWKCCDSSPAD